MDSGGKVAYPESEAVKVSSLRTRMTGQEAPQPWGSGAQVKEGSWLVAAAVPVPREDLA